MTNAEGDYRLSPLPPGTYAITVELPGFQALKRLPRILQAVVTYTV